MQMALFDILLKKLINQIDISLQFQVLKKDKNHSARIWQKLTVLLLKKKQIFIIL